GVLSSSRRMTRLGRTWTWASLLLAVAATVPGCGGSSAPSQPPDPSRFVGTWEVVASLLSVVCSNGGKQTVEITAPTTFALGTTSDLVDTDPTCPIRYDVAGDVATAQPRQRCARPELITTLNLDDVTFTLSGGGSAAHAGSGVLDRFNDITV